MGSNIKNQYQSSNLKIELVNYDIVLVQQSF